MTPLSTLLNEAFSNSPEKYQKIGFREAHRIKTTKVFSPNEHVGYQVDAFVHGAYSAEKRLRPLFEAMKECAEAQKLVEALRTITKCRYHGDANTIAEKALDKLKAGSGE